jgi:Xaa-Pro aminopeptidase
MKQSFYKATAALSLCLATLTLIASASNLYISAAPEPLLANQPLSEYKARRQRLMEQIKDGVVVLGGAHASDFGEVGRFRQNNFFQYLTGVETPGAALVLVPKGLDGAKEILFIPARNLTQERWTGPQLGPGAEAEASFGFERVLPSAEFAKVIKRLAATEKVFHTLTPRPTDTTLARERLFAEQLRALVGDGAEFKSVANQIARLRQTKSPSEVALLQKAIDATGEAHASLARALRPGVFEYELEAEVMAAFLRGGAERASFPSIIGSGIFSTVLHYERNRKRVDAGDLVVADIGAEYSYYAADITRTYPASGRFTPRQRAIYDLVLEAQRRVAESIKPGRTMLFQLTQATHDIFAASPLRAKDERGHEQRMDHFFIHSTSHYLGMDVHDVGDSSRPLQPGDVITIEPGIYIPGEKLGVRIEDDYLVTADGVRKLSAAIPSGAVEIERLLGKAKPARQ